MSKFMPQTPNEAFRANVPFEGASEATATVGQGAIQIAPATIKRQPEGFDRNKFRDGVWETQELRLV